MRSLLTSLALLLAWANPVAGAWPNDPNVNLPVTTASGEQRRSTIAGDGSGGAFVTWEDLRADSLAADIYVQHVLANGMVDPAWPLDGRALCTAPGGQVGPRAVSDGTGGVIVAWADLRYERPPGLGNLFAQHVLANGTVDPIWPPEGSALCSAFHCGAFNIATDNAGGAIATWNDSRAGNWDIYAQRVLANGVVDPLWPVDGFAVFPGPTDDIAPTLVSDGGHGAIVTWFSWYPSSNIFAMHILGTGRVDPLFGGSVVCDAVGNQWLPTLVSDGSGGAIITWYDDRGIHTDIYAQHVLSTAAVDPAWPRNGRALCTAVGTQWDPAIASDGAGGAIVAWDDRRSGGVDNLLDADIYAQHVMRSGVIDPSWPVNGRAICTDPGIQWRAMIVADGVGGAIVAWDDYRNSNDDIFAQHVLRDGQIDPLWPQNGAAVCSASGNQQIPFAGETGSLGATSDLAGGAILTWADYRVGPAADIYAQRIEVDGVLGPPCVNVGLDLKPRHLNLNSKGKVVTCFITPPTPYLASQIDLNSLRLNHVAMVPSGVEDGGTVLKVQFPREQLVSTLVPDGRVPVTIEGQIGGVCFQGVDTIAVSVPKISSPKGGEFVLAGGVTDVVWNVTDEADPNIALLISFDDGVTWDIAADHIANVGNYSWSVPPFAVSRVRLAIVGLYGMDPSGIIPESEYAVSDAFSINVPTSVTGRAPVFELRPVNPVRGRLKLSYSLPATAAAQIFVFDVTGRKVLARDLSAVGSGHHSIEFAELPAGLYLVQLNQSGHSLFSRVAVLK